MNQELTSQPLEAVKKRRLLKLLSQGRKNPVYFAEYFLDVKLHIGQKIFLWASTHTMPEKMREVLDERFGKERGEQIFQYVWNTPKIIFILVPSNRWGKTLLIAVKHLWMQFYKIGVQADGELFTKVKYKTFNVSPVGEQAMACYQYILDILQSKFVYRDERGFSHNNQCKIGFMFMSKNENARTIQLVEGRTFKCSTLGNDTKGATAIQGSDYYYGSFDECSEAERLMLEIPRIKSRLIDHGGALDLMGTPSSQSKSVQSYQHVVNAGLKLKEGYFTLAGIMEDNTFLSPEDIAAAKKEYMEKFPHLFAQVFKGEFVSSGGKMFAGHEIEQLWTDSLFRPAPGTLPEVNKFLQTNLIFSIDWGFAEQGDPSVGYVIDYTEMPYKILFHFNELNPDPWKIFAYVREVKAHFKCPLIMDTNAMGGTIIAKLLGDLHPLHFDFHGKVKQDGLLLLKQALSWKRDAVQMKDGSIIERNPEFGKLRSYHILELEEQLSWYQIKDDKIAQDHVMALMMAIYHIDKNPPLAKPYAAAVAGRRTGKSAFEP